MADRANYLAEGIKKYPVLGDSPFNIIAHSMGGLDGRYLISRLDFSDQVRSLVSLATPHRGTYVADLAMKTPALKNLLKRYLPAVDDLTCQSSKKFNNETPDSPEVAYLSIAAWTKTIWCSPLMMPAHLILKAHGEKNDGLVPISSMEWGQVLETVEADHMELIGLKIGLNVFRGYEHLALYGGITEVLKKRGF